MKNLLTLTTVLALAACGGKSTTPTTPTEPDHAEHHHDEGSAAAATTPEPTPDPEKPAEPPPVAKDPKAELVAAEDDPSRARVVLSVHESSFNELRLGGGLGLELQRTDAHLSLLYTRRNFLGGLRTLTLKLEPTEIAALEEPYEPHPVLGFS